MPRIHQLPPTVVTKIAAGEVIERPASVVKELLENAVDAGATRIDIDLEQGGTELIRVCDDGHGIDPADLPLVFASHATSKLKDADDLFRIGTLGFRGEAMASIGGVAKVTVQSRAAGRADGGELLCDGGELGEVRPWNGSPGTRVEVRHLFFNTPVRKKFLRAMSTELGHVVETGHQAGPGEPPPAPRPAAQRPAGPRGPRGRRAGRAHRAVLREGRPGGPDRGGWRTRTRSR